MTKFALLTPAGRHNGQKLCNNLAAGWSTVAMRITGASKPGLRRDRGSDTMATGGDATWGQACQYWC